MPSFDFIESIKNCIGNKIYSGKIFEFQKCFTKQNDAGFCKPNPFSSCMNNIIQPKLFSSCNG